MSENKILSPARRTALRRLHAARRGQRIHDTGRERETVLAEFASAVREPVRGARSIRVAAEFVRVHDRTLRRWLHGEHWPEPTRLRRLAQWVAAIRRR